MAVFCTKCGAQNDDYSQTCLQCHAPLPNLGGYQPIQPPTPIPYGQTAVQDWQKPEIQDWKKDAEKRALCGILGITLGGFGIHKFVLGYNQEGLIMLLGSVLSCGTLYPVMEAIAIFEGIKYLRMTDEEFGRAYILKKTGWF